MPYWHIDLIHTNMTTINYRGWLAIIGGVIVHLSIGTLYTFGNMSPYLTSYIRERSKPENLRYQDATIIFAVMICGQGLMVPFSGFLLTKLGFRTTTLLGGWIMSAGVLLSYLTIQSSFYALVITYGFMFGAGVGIAYLPPLVCSMKWFPENKGRANGFVMAGYGGGSFVFNQVQTAYINPNNVAPNISLPKHPDEKYFDDPEVLDNVPYSFLILGAVYAVMQLIGVLLLSEPQEESHDKMQENCHSREKGIFLKTKNKNEDGSVSPSIETTLDTKGSGLNLRPTEVVKTRAFWILWWTFFLNVQGPYFISTLYKAFGQTFISDDNFLALVGAFSAIGSAGGRLFWGILADIVSYKTSMLFLCSTFTVFLLTIMAAPYAGKPMFFIWIFMIFFIFSGNIPLIPTATARAFGAEHVGINYGLIFASNVITGPMAVLLPVVLQDTIGWNGMFGLLSGLSVISNMSPYLTSYIRERSKPEDLRYQDTSIIFAVLICGQGLMMPCSGFLLTKLGLRLTTLLGGWIMSAGMLLSYLTIQSSFYVLAITYGFMVGVGVGIAYTPPLVCSMKWLTNRKGLANGCVVAGFGGGSFIFNQVQTAYINPNNIAPNISLPKHPDEKYFDDPEVLDNVPNSFLILGAIYAVMQLIGVLLLFEPEEHRHDKIQGNLPSSERMPLMKNKHEYKDSSVGPSIKTTLDTKGSGLNLRPTEVVKTRAFWIIWSTFALNAQGSVFMTTLYKAFGQTFISDDTFLALVGAFGAIGNAGGRIFWGILADMFSYKTAMLFLCSTFTVFMLIIMTAPYGGKPMFFILIFIIFVILSGNYSLFPTVAARAFGTEHVGINYGLIFASKIISGPIAVFLPIVLQDAIGWNGMFGLISGISVISFILTLTFNVKRPTGENI
ncbi:uncharacterized protein [Amphiura filiformis]|uniref:uncharacterized protein n=1 Tax=Amphiura filiformis TaxID=82378 RepID=UPI003B20DF29